MLLKMMIRISSIHLIHLCLLNSLFWTCAYSMFGEPCKAQMGFRYGTSPLDDVQFSVAVSSGNPDSVRLNSPEAWTPKVSDSKDSWIQINTSTPVLMTGLQIQGTQKPESWVTGWTLLTSLDCENYQTQDYTMEPESSRHAVEISLYNPVFVYCLQLFPTKYYGPKPTLRLELLGCVLNEPEPCSSRVDPYREDSLSVGGQRLNYAQEVIVAWLEVSLKLSSGGRGEGDVYVYISRDCITWSFLEPFEMDLVSVTSKDQKYRWLTLDLHTPVRLKCVRIFPPWLTVIEEVFTNACASKVVPRLTPAKFQVFDEDEHHEIYMSDAAVHDDEAEDVSQHQEDTTVLSSDKKDSGKKSGLLDYLMDVNKLPEEVVAGHEHSTTATKFTKENVEKDQIDNGFEKDTSQNSSNNEKDTPLSSVDIEKDTMSVSSTDKTNEMPLILSTEKPTADSLMSESAKDIDEIFSESTLQNAEDTLGELLDVDSQTEDDSDLMLLDPPANELLPSSENNNELVPELPENLLQHYEEYQVTDFMDSLPDLSLEELYDITTGSELQHENDTTDLTGFLFSDDSANDRSIPEVMYFEDTLVDYINDEHNLDNYTTRFNHSECGIKPEVSGERRKRVVSGYKNVPGEWPWLVALHFYGETNFTAESGYNQLCGASLITDEWVLAAAHCFSELVDPNLSNLSLWEVFLGQHDLGETDEEELSWLQRRKIKEIVTHPASDLQSSTPLKSDLALIRLDRPVNLTRRVSPVCLDELDYFLEHPGHCIVSGWGKRNDTTTGQQFPHSAPVKLIPLDTCKQIYDALPDDHDTRAWVYTGPEVVCAIGQGGEDACQGDSGGPLMCENDGRWFQIGVVSGGFACGEPEFPAFYTRVAFHTDWISRTIGL